MHTKIRKNKIDTKIQQITRIQIPIEIETHNMHGHLSMSFDKLNNDDMQDIYIYNRCSLCSANTVYRVV